MSSRTHIRNRNAGPGTQNNYNVVGTQNIVYGGEAHFLQNFNPSDSNAYKLLRDAIAGIGASHDSEQQYQRGECLPKTREKAIERIFNWILSPDEHPLLWLTGAAGVGKTAIAITIAKLCKENGRLVTSFFFFRADSKRNNPSALILSIAFGLVTAMPPLRTLIEERISKDPRILEACLEDQFQELVVKPLMDSQALPSPKPLESSFCGSESKRMRTGQTEPPYLVIIDGLDECDDEKAQKRILSTIRSAFEHSTSFPLRFLICSRPESWLCHAFNARPLQQLHEHIVLDDSFEPDKDIERYYHHHFQEIAADPEYNQICFPNPWPSRADFRTLMWQTGSQFAYAVTAVRFIRDPFRLPTEQLQVILKKTPPRGPGTLPFAQLDALYHHILSFNPHYEDVRLILAAILVIPNADYIQQSARCPACIELVLGLSKGQVALTMRGMHSVLDIRGSGDEIWLRHNSFREYLVDSNRSGSFHIDITAMTYTIARTWLQNLSREKIQCYSSNQLWDEESRPFFWLWVQFCALIPGPTQELLNLLYDLDLAAVSVFKLWKRPFEGLALWVEKYPCVGPTAGRNQVGSATRYHRKAGRALRSTAYEYPSHDNEQRDVNSFSREIDPRRDGLDLVERVLYKFQNYPQCFHLEWPPSVSPPDHVIYWIVARATGCMETARLYKTRPRAIDDIRIMECRCDLSGGKQSRDPRHVAYQEGCLKLVKAYIPIFEELSQGGPDDPEWKFIFRNLTHSALLKHCHLDAKLFSLCRSFFELAKGSLNMRLNSNDGKKGRQNMLKWFETFPDRFTAEGEALKEQLLGLPWQQWAQNWDDVFGRRRR